MYVCLIIANILNNTFFRFLYFFTAHSMDLKLFKNRIINLQQWQERSPTLIG